MNGNFKYNPLHQSSEIRLVELLPGQRGDEITCQLQNYSLDESHTKPDDLSHLPPYSALSYTWGAPLDTVQIQVNATPFHVRRNLYNALAELRSTSRPIMYWIDAICINQADVEERNSQVSRMRRIYEQSAMVTIWLGPEGDGSDYAMEMVLNIRHHFYRKLAEGQKYKAARMSLLNSSLGIFGDAKKDFEIPHKISVLKSLYERPWFSRVWIIQESTTLNDSVLVCGKRSILWSDFKTATSLIAEFGRTWDTGIEGVEKIPTDRPVWLGAIRHSSASRSQELTTTLDLLAYMTRFEATDPRDKLYSIIHLATDKLLDTLRIDYRMPVQDVYIDAIRSILNQSQPEDRLHFLGYCSSSSADHNEIPSWTPDWRRPATVRPFPKKMMARPSPPAEESRATGAVYSAGILGTDGLFAFNYDTYIPRIENKALEVYGFEVDVIKQTFTLLPPSILERGRELSRSSICDATYFTGESFWGAYMRTASADVVRSSGRPIARGFGIDGKSFAGPTAREDPHLKKDFECVGRHFATTRKGRMGLVRNDALPNDRIFVFLAGHVLYVLRPRDDGSYSFVGESYIHGLMDGEAFELLQKGATTTIGRILLR